MGTSDFGSPYGTMDRSRHPQPIKRGLSEQFRTFPRTCRRQMLHPTHFPLSIEIILATRADDYKSSTPGLKAPTPRNTPPDPTSAGPVHEGQPGPADRSL